MNLICFQEQPWKEAERALEERNLASQLLADKLKTMGSDRGLKTNKQTNNLLLPKLWWPGSNLWSSCENPLPQPDPSLFSKPPGEELIGLWSEALCGGKALGLYLMRHDILQKVTSKGKSQGSHVRQKWSQNWWEDIWAGTQTQISILTAGVLSMAASLLPTRHPAALLYLPHLVWHQYYFAASIPSLAT